MSREQEVSDEDESKARKVFARVADRITWKRLGIVALNYLLLFVVALVITYLINFFGIGLVVVAGFTILIHASLVRDTPLERSWGK